MTQHNEIRKSILYNSLNELLCERMPKIHREIENTLSNRDFNDVIQNIECKLEIHPWGQSTQWRIDTQADEHPYDEAGRPFGLGGFVFLEEVAKQKILHFKTQWYNDFDKTTIKKNTTKIPYHKVNDLEFIKPFIRETEKFLDELYEKFVMGCRNFCSGMESLEDRMGQNVI